MSGDADGDNTAQNPSDAQGLEDLSFQWESRVNIMIGNAQIVHEYLMKFFSSMQAIDSLKEQVVKGNPFAMFAIAELMIPAEHKIEALARTCRELESGDAK